MKIESDPSPEELAFVRQLGVDHVFTWVPEDRTDRTHLASLKQKVEDHGLTLYNVGCLAYGKSDQIHLALERRDQIIERFQGFATNLGSLGIGVSTFTWEPTHVWSSERGESRGASARHADLAEMVKRPYTHDRLYTREELWENFGYFMDKMTPVLRSSGVRLALHPNDPPTVETLGGVPCLIYGRQEYDRAFTFAPADVLGMEFCCGCWLEGAETFGDIPDGIRHFAAQDRILIVHFRNISAPLPEFTEAFLDNGHVDMYPFMKTFCDVDYQGTIILDHTPVYADPFDAGAGPAYAIGYMRALMERAAAERA